VGLELPGAGVRELGVQDGVVDRAGGGDEPVVGAVHDDVLLVVDELVADHSVAGFGLLGSGSLCSAGHRVLARERGV
jgi:hypothetical protein